MSEAPANPVATSPPATSPLAKLPVRAVAAGAFALVFREFGTLARAAWLWLAVATPTLFLIYWLLAAYQPGAAAPSAAGIVVKTSDTWTTLLELVVASSVAVAWHRRVLTGEPVALPAYLRLDLVVMKFWLAGILIALPVWIPIQAGSLIASASPGLAADYDTLKSTVLAGKLANIALVFYGVIMWLFLVPRLSIVLPAKALDVPQVTMRKVWNATRGQTWRIAAANLLTVLPSLLGETAYAALLERADDPILLAAAKALNFAVSTLLGIFVASFHALAYRHFFATDPTALNPPP
jgi:hypothetical protein